MSEKLYEVSATDSGVSWPGRYIALRESGYLCRACNRILPHTFPAPLDVVVRNFTDADFEVSCSHAKGANCLLFNLAFLNFLPFDRSEYATGGVFLADGSKSANYVTCYTRESNLLVVTSRGGHYVDKTCDLCGAIKNTAWSLNGNGYVRHSQTAGRGVWIASQHTLVVSAAWKSRIIDAGFPNLQFSPIDIEPG